MMKIEYTPIGILHSPFMKQTDMPIQPTAAAGIKGTIELFTEFREGLDDIGGFSHIILLYHFHRSHDFNLKVVPFMDSVSRGLFSTRAPRRPNPIGLSVVQLDKVENNILYINNVDMLDGTPLLDIKPYIPEFDAQDNVRTGWFTKTREAVSRRRSDDRFE